jgi:hypothetical protein
MPITSADRKDFNAFSELLAITGPYLPMNFIIAIFQHLRECKQGDYDHIFLINAIRLTRRLSIKQDLTQDELAIAYAIIFLMETGHAYSDDFPYEVSPGLTYSFLKQHALGFFNPVDERFISRSCRPVYPHSMKLSDRTRITILVHNVRTLTDVVYPNPAKLVTVFVKANKDPSAVDNDEPINIEEWVGALAEKFTARYGYKGTIWNAVSSGAKEVYREEIHKFNVIAENQELIRNLIHQNAKHIFA